jgi:hypothetical protein
MCFGCCCLPAVGDAAVAYVDPSPASIHVIGTAALAYQPLADPGNRVPPSLFLTLPPVHMGAACAAVAVSTPHEAAANYDLLLGECMLEGAPLIMRCNTMPVQQAEAVDQLLRQVC